MKIRAYAATGAKQPLKEFSYDVKNLLDDFVEIKITHCGVCHSDIHLIDNDWGNALFPLVPGHEIVGTVTKAGSAVKEFSAGQRVGVGWQCGSCGQCEWCHRAEENLCPAQQATCLGNFGGFAESIRVHHRFVFSIPEKFTSAQVAPLFCGGVTVYSPLRQYIHSPTMRVGVIGVGGLGHLALQFAHAFGCEVFAFSHSPDKKAESLQLGANHFVTTDETSLKKLQGQLDFIISTAPEQINWMPFINALRPKGKLCIVGAVAGNVNVPVFSLISGRKGIVGSNIGDCHTIEEMLEFAARRNINAHVETFLMSNVNEAIAKVKKGDVHYRAVLESDW